MKSELIELKKFIEFLESGEFDLIDVRTEEEHIDGHLKMSKNINVNNENFQDLIGELDKEKKYLVYCRTDNRTRNAMYVMEMLGFKEVYGLIGGFNKWVENELEFEKLK